MNILQKAAIKIFKREPDIVIGDGYLERWYVIPRNRFFNIYLHKFIGSDDDRATHDHPWHSVSFLLKGQLREIYGVNLAPDVHGIYRDIPWLKPIYRPATFSHRLVVEDGPVWTLFITGPRIREWVCSKHWAVIPKIYRRVFRRVSRELRLNSTSVNYRRFKRIWKKCVDQAEQNAGYL